MSCAAPAAGGAAGGKPGIPSFGSALAHSPKATSFLLQDEARCVCPLQLLFHRGLCFCTISKSLGTVYVVWRVDLCFGLVLPPTPSSATLFRCPLEDG